MDTANGEAGAFFYVLQEPICILYVDDDPILREFAQVHLTTEVASVVVAADGVEAMDLLKTARPDIILLDLEMPRMDGFEVLARLRGSREHARIPVIVATGREDVDAIDRAFQCGATSFVVKPLNWRLLSYQIRYVQRTHRTELGLIASEEAARSALERLCHASSRFVAQALGVAPILKDSALICLDVLEFASGVRDSQAASG